MTVHTDSTTASQSPPLLTSGGGRSTEWGGRRRERRTWMDRNKNKYKQQMGGRRRGGRNLSRGAMSVSATDSECRENQRKRRMKRSETGARAEGWETDGLQRGGGRGEESGGGAKVRWVNPEEQRRGHANTQREVENRFRSEEIGGKFTVEGFFSSGRVKRWVETTGLVDVDWRVKSL